LLLQEDHWTGMLHMLRREITITIMPRSPDRVLHMEKNVNLWWWNWN